MSDTVYPANCRPLNESLQEDELIRRLKVCNRTRTMNLFQISHKFLNFTNFFHDVFVFVILIQFFLICFKFFLFFQAFES